MRAGNVIDVRLPVKKGDGSSGESEQGDEKSNDPSGRYLISELRHLLGGGKSETQLTLIRDVFTA